VQHITKPQDLVVGTIRISDQTKTKEIICYVSKLGSGCNLGKICLEQVKRR